MKVETSTLSLTEKAVAAIQAAVAGVVTEHQRRKKPLAVWRDGRVVKELPIAEGGVHETIGHYQTERHTDSLDDGST
jgi:hypothetical protein